ncbi:glucagon receptor-like isoform X1 [Scleropages formosus]|uniref:Glucagon receptor b n=2 Tax=Scleropages formosus TaxID=113540 RepID=A0A8C9WSZ1_SCLFO|nr:glucagon receptor-like isoform X1 [Scleropages formosus]XP_018603513.1 glucagon receptor-like isoform X1 [Scleropages formosus]XP_018603514.1 glucagon receptor-like isoform X1 [Scleropages formosus]XP_018603515.1 glucagon receptor-like isoform X1 [Scleropages formosus]XP_018603516.1 glucagon receptor-like isoform X1 [Scleropages formosus]
MSQGFLLLVLLAVSASTQACSGKIVKVLMERWMSYKNECMHTISTDPPATAVVCNRTFDQYACWPDGVPGTIVNVSCPWYLPWYYEVQHGLVFSVCDKNGKWTSRNTSECDQEDSAQQQYGQMLAKLQVMYTVGYSLSLGALTLALTILVAFRKLHCMRNNIHMNLFASFILRALSILVKDALLNTSQLNFSENATLDYQVENLVNDKMVTGCRIAVVMMQYSVMANNYWLLVEGIYLHNLLVVTVFTERNYFKIYLCIGWGAPLMFLLPWIVVKYLYENEECWQTNISMGYWWIIRSPILFAVLVNFFIFIRIIKILMTKLKAHQMRYTDYKFRLAKSTLTLIPLLGIHAILFIFVLDDNTAPTDTLRLAKLFYSLFFNSFQGLLVAILYCFVNKEVQSEMLKKWKRWKLGKDIEEEYRHTHSQTPHGKTGSLVANPPELLEGTKNTGGDQENGTGKINVNLQLANPPQDSANNCSALMESVYLERKALCCEDAESSF